MRSSPGSVTRAGNSSRKRGGVRLHVKALGIAAGAAPVGGFGAEQFGRVEIHGLAMVFIHVLDRALLGLDQRGGVADLGQELLRLEIDDAAKARNQMRARGADAKEGEILEVDKCFRRRVRVEIAAAQPIAIIAGPLPPPGPPP